MFQNLFVRAQTCAQLQDVLLEEVLRNREARSGKPFQYSKRQHNVLAEFDRDAERARQKEEELADQMDDTSLLANALIGEEHQLQWDTDLYLTMPPEVRESANRVLEFRSDTIRILNKFIEISPLKEKVQSILREIKN